MNRERVGPKPAEPGIEQLCWLLTVNTNCLGALAAVVQRIDDTSRKLLGIERELAKLRKVIDDAVHQRHEHMLLPEVATEAGVALDTVRHWIKLGTLPSTRPGRRRIVLRQDFDLFMLARNQTPKRRNRRIKQAEPNK